jgi:hypothetical protein
MKKLFGLCALLAIMFALPAQSSVVTYNGTVSASTVGSSLSTDLPMWDSSSGTLTGVTVTLNLTVTPYAQVYNFSGSPLTFQASHWITFGYNSSNTWTISHNTDSWSLTAPTVSTGTIYGSGQVVQPYPAAGLTLVGSTSAPVSLTASALTANLAEYIGTGTLVFGTSGMGNVLVSAGQLYGGGGGNLTGTASVTYEYIPEPATIMLLGLGALSLLRKRKA